MMTPVGGVCFKVEIKKACGKRTYENKTKQMDMQIVFTSPKPEMPKKPMQYFLRKMLLKVGLLKS